MKKLNIAMYLIFHDTGFGYPCLDRGQSKRRYPPQIDMDVSENDSYTLLIAKGASRI